MAKTIKARILGNNTINAEITSGANINASVRGNGSIRAEVNTYSSATTEKKGIIRIATDEEAIEGLSDNTAITPKTLKLATSYTHIQGTASEVWTINHNLNKNPSITIVDSANNVVSGRRKYVDENTVELYFNSAFKGSAYLN